jgi:hypothetical protein
MKTSTKVLGTAAVLALTALQAPGGAMATDKGTGGPARGELVGSVPSDPTVHGTAPGGLPWVTHKSSSAKLFPDGRLSVKVKGLLFTDGPFVGTPGPVSSVSASVYCGADATPAVASTGTVPLSRRRRRADRRGRHAPEPCADPVVLVHPFNATAFYIALVDLES